MPLCVVRICMNQTLYTGNMCATFLKITLLAFASRENAKIQKKKNDEALEVEICS